MSWMWGAPVQGYVQASAKAQGVPEKQITDAIAATIPLRRLVTDDECARAALMLLSDYASAVTGATLDANGGEVMPATANHATPKRQRTWAKLLTTNLLDWKV